LAGTVELSLSLPVVDTRRPINQAALEQASDFEDDTNFFNNLTKSDNPALKMFPADLPT
jgi:hypothetical protein